MIKVELKEIEFDNDGKMLNHDDIHSTPLIAMYRGEFYYGKVVSRSFSRFGFGVIPFQYDPPNTNSRLFQKVWAVIDSGGLMSGEAMLIVAGINPVELSNNLEAEYAVKRRAYSIRCKCTYRGKRITEESPITAWGYYSTEPLMPPNEDGEYPDEVNMY